jgi:hypothetical protein
MTMRVTPGLIVGIVVLLIGIVFRKPYLSVPIATVVCSLIDLISRPWWTSERIGKWTSFIIILKFVLSLCATAALLGTIVSLGLAVWWFV